MFSIRASCAQPVKKQLNKLDGDSDIPVRVVNLQLLDGQELSHKVVSDVEEHG